MTTTSASPRDPSALLFGEDHRRLLGLLLMRPDQNFHVREIARLTGVNAGNAHRALKRMERAGLVTTTRAGHQVRYQADRSCPIFDELAGIMRKTSGMADVLRQALAPLEPRIKAAFVFGSVARGEEGPRSDVDLMVVGHVSFEEVVEATYPAQERLRREINPVVAAPADFARRLKAGDRFVTRLMNEPKLMLLGTLE